MPTRVNRQQCKHSWTQIKSFTFRASKYYFSFNFNNFQVFLFFLHGLKFSYYNRMTLKHPPALILRNLDNFPPGAFYSTLPPYN